MQCTYESLGRKARGDWSEVGHGSSEVVQRCKGRIAQEKCKKYLKESINKYSVRSESIWKREVQKKRKYGGVTYAITQNRSLTFPPLLPSILLTADGVRTLIFLRMDTERGKKWLRTLQKQSRQVLRTERAKNDVKIPVLYIQLEPNRSCYEREARGYHCQLNIAAIARWLRYPTQFSSRSTCLRTAT